jgi:hypothetical protein
MSQSNPYASKGNHSGSVAEKGPDDSQAAADAAPSKVANAGQPDPVDPTQGPEEPAAGGDAYTDGAGAVDMPEAEAVAGPEEALSADDTQLPVDPATVGNEAAPVNAGTAQENPNSKLSKSDDSSDDEDDLDEVLSGSVSEVNDWVGDDKDRAQAVLDAETSEDGKNRKGVVSNAETVLEDDEED